MKPSWEIWIISPDDRALIYDVEKFGDDEGEAQARFSELQAEAMKKGGAFELRRDGVYVSFFSCTPPVVKGDP